ncbi:MAG: hypothetical protein CSA75_04135, partial [Sorangium cellulosum]
MPWARSSQSAVVVALALVAFGCDKDPTTPSTPEASPSESTVARRGSDQIKEVKVGDLVVVESGKANFWEGKVLRVEGSTVVYEYGVNRAKGEAEIHRVYVLKEGRQTAAKTNDMAVCKTGPAAWNACEIKRLERGVFVADDVWGKAHELNALDVIFPNEATRGRIKEKLGRASGHRDFINAAKAAGLPRKPEGWQPRPGDDIVAKFTDSSWYGGRIRRLTPTKIHVAWDDKSKPSERNHEQVAPKPKEAFEVREGQYVLGRPR